MSSPITNAEHKTVEVTISQTVEVKIRPPILESILRLKVESQHDIHDFDLENWNEIAHYRPE